MHQVSNSAPGPGERPVESEWHSFLKSRRYPPPWMMQKMGFLADVVMW